MGRFCQGLATGSAVSMVGMYVGMQYMRFMAGPYESEESTLTYSYWGGWIPQIMPDTDLPEDDGVGTEKLLVNTSSEEFLNPSDNFTSAALSPSDGAHVAGNGTMAVASAALSKAPDTSRRRMVPMRAVIVDPVWDEALEATILNFLTVLGSDVPIRWYHDYRTTDWPARIKSPILKAAVEARHLDQFPFRGHITKKMYNQLRMKGYFYKSIAAEHVLMFERDAVLCSGSSRKLTDFTMHDYIGAPWPPRVDWCKGLKPYHCCCNSGLSFVNTERMIEVVEEFETSAAGTQQNDMYLLEYRKHGKDTFHQAQRREAMKFSVEAVWDNNETPFGVHKPWWAVEEFKTMDLKHLRNVCPEITRLCGYAKAVSGVYTRSGGRHARTFIRDVCT